MKKKKHTETAYSVPISVITLLFILIFVFINTPTVDGLIKATLSDVEALNPSDTDIAKSFSAVRDSYEKRSDYIYLTVSHSLMAEVDECFAEFEGAVLAGNEDEITQAKSRLIDALMHLRRLSGFKLESII